MILKDRRVESLDLGRLAPCPDCGPERHKERLEKLLQELPDEMRVWNWESMALNHPHLEADRQSEYRQLVNGVRYWNRQGHKEYPFLVLCGPDSWGKTRLAVQCLTERIHNPAIGPAGLFVRSPDLLTRLRAGFQDNSTESQIAVYQKAQMLVVDDLGAERGSSWVDEQLCRILDDRYVEFRLTILTTKSPVAKLHPRLADRLMDTRLCYVLDADFPGYAVRARNRRPYSRREGESQ